MAVTTKSFNWDPLGVFAKPAAVKPAPAINWDPLGLFAPKAAETKTSIVAKTAPIAKTAATTQTAPQEVTPVASSKPTATAAPAKAVPVLKDIAVLQHPGHETTTVAPTTAPVATVKPTATTAPAATLAPAHTEEHSGHAATSTAATSGGTTSDLIHRAANGTVGIDTINAAATVATGAVQKLVNAPATLGQKLTMGVAPDKTWDLAGAFTKLATNATNNFNTETTKMANDIQAIFTPSGKSTTLAAQIGEPFADAAKAFSTGIQHLIPGTDNFSGQLIRDTYNAVEQTLYSIPKALTIGNIPVISTIGDAAARLVGGVTDMADIVLDHALMMTGGLADNASTVIEGSSNITQNIANNNTCADPLAINCTSEVDSIGDIFRAINEQKFNEISSHIAHDAQLIDEVPETISQVLAGLGNDLGIGCATTPVVNAVNGAFDFALHDVLATGIIGTGLLDPWHQASQIVFGENSINLNGPGSMNSEEHDMGTCGCENVDMSGHTVYQPLEHITAAVPATVI